LFKVFQQNVANFCYSSVLLIIFFSWSFVFVFYFLLNAGNCFLASVSAARGIKTPVDPFYYSDKVISQTLPPDNVGNGCMFSTCPSATCVRSFIRTDLVTTISRERLEQS